MSMVLTTVQRECVASSPPKVGCLWDARVVLAAGGYAAIHGRKDVRNGVLEAMLRSK